MTWSARLMLVGVLICSVGFVPLYMNGVTLDTLLGAASFIAIGMFVFLIGLLLRKLTRAFRST